MMQDNEVLIEVGDKLAVYAGVELSSSSGQVTASLNKKSDKR
jgi:hypothetical protein